MKVNLTACLKDWLLILNRCIAYLECWVCQTNDESFFFDWQGAALKYYSFIIGDVMVVFDPVELRLVPISMCWYGAEVLLVTDSLHGSGIPADVQNTEC